MKYAYLNYRVRFFEQRKGEKVWTSRYDSNWWCKTLVDENYFRASDEEAEQRPQWANDRQKGRVVEDVSFRPLKHNADAAWDDRFLSKAAVWKLRHSDPKDFINGVAMDIESFIDYMIDACRWIRGGSDWRNKKRFKSRDFDTENFTCEWDMKGSLHMLEMCSDYPRFALITLRRPRVNCTSDEAAKGCLLLMKSLWTL